MARIVYATRSDIETSPTARYPPGLRTEILESLRKASQQADDAARRQFHPTLAATRYYNYPSSSVTDGTLWLDDTDLLTVNTLTVAGTVISSADYVLEPVNDGPPYQAIRILDTSSSSWGSGDSRFRAIQVDADIGYTQETRAAGTLTLAPTGTAGTTFTGADPTKVDVGHLAKINDEWVNVTGRSFLDSGATITGALTDNVTDRTLTVSSAAGLVEGETLAIDFEEMTIRRIDGTSVLVERATGGTTLAAHSGGAGFDRWNSYTIERAVIGSTAATHSNDDAVAVWVPPPLARELVIATAITDLQQHSSAYARTVGSGEAEREFKGVGLKDTRDQFDRWLRRKRLIGSF